MLSINLINTLQYLQTHLQMASNRIFSGNARYQPQPQGRNVNLGGSMIKRAPIFTCSADKQQSPSPFLNYSWRSGESFFAQSQGSTLEQRINPDIIKQMIKEELSKLPSAEDSSRKQFQTVQAQFTDLKDRIAEYESICNQKLQENVVKLKEEMKMELREQLQLELKEQSERMEKEVQIEISAKLRTFFQKTNIEMKKDILGTVGEQFLSFDYGEDLQNRLSLMNQKLQTIDHLLQNKNICSPQELQKKDRFELTENIESTLLKLEKQQEIHKKQAQDLSSRIRQAQERINQVNTRRDTQQIQQKVQFVHEKLKQIDQQCIGLLKRVSGVQSKQGGIEGDLKLLRAKINDNSNKNDELKLLVADLTKRASLNESFIDEIKMTPKITESLTYPIKIQNRNGIMSPNKVLTPSKIRIYQESSQNRESPNTHKARYQVDKDGYLMDGEGKYLLTENNQMVWLNDQQISILMNSQQVQIIDS